MCDSIAASPTSDDSSSSAVKEAYTYTKDAASDCVTVPDIVELFNKLTYEVLANTVLGSEWISIMPSFGEWRVYHYELQSPTENDSGVLFENILSNYSFILALYCQGPKKKVMRCLLRVNVN